MEPVSDMQCPNRMTSRRLSALGDRLRAGCQDQEDEPYIGYRVVEQLLIDVLGNGNLEPLHELVAPTCVGHFWDGDYYGPEGLRIETMSYRSAFPDLAVRIDDLFACGVRVVRSFTVRGTQTGPFHGRPPTGKTVELTGIGIDLVIDGRLQESWVVTEFAPRAPPPGG